MKATSPPDSMPHRRRSAAGRLVCPRWETFAVDTREFTAMHCNMALLQGVIVAGFVVVGAVFVVMAVAPQELAAASRAFGEVTAEVVVATEADAAVAAAIDAAGRAA